MRVLVYGVGVIGSIFAGKLQQIGVDVTVLARSSRYEELKQKGLILNEGDSTKKEIMRPNIIDKLEKEDVYDYIFVCMQKTQVETVLPILNENKSKQIVFIVNNALGYENWVKAVGSKRLMIGFPAAGGERINGEIRYFIMRGILNSFQITTFAEYSGKKTKRLGYLIHMFNQAGIPSKGCNHMDAWQKTHVAMVTAIGNMLYQYNSNNYEAAKHFKDLKCGVKSIKEGHRVVKALGYKITPVKMNLFMLPSFLITLVFMLIFKTRFAEIAMAKHTIAAKDEMICLQKEFDVLIKQSGLKTPYIDKMKRYLSE